MARDAGSTRERILDAAEAAVLRRGFSATSVDDIQAGAQVSRGTFFYHFPSKSDLAHALMSRYAEADMRTAADFMARAAELTPDPLHQVLIFVGLYIEMLEGAEDPPSGCLIASYAYESGLFGEDTRALLVANFRSWCELVGGRLDAAMERHPVQPAVTGADLAELLYGIIEGAYVVSRIDGGRPTLAKHLRHYRTHLEMLFGLRSAAAPSAAPSADVEGGARPQGVGATALARPASMA